MTQRTISYAIAAICVVGIAAVAWWSFQQRTSPGPLASAHAVLPELSGNAGCSACHGSGTISARASMDGACLSCHEPIKQQQAAKSGIHGKLNAQTFAACETCHHEHLGDTVALVSESAFKAAGVIALKEYDHAHVGGLGLEGKHTSIACTACHPKADAPVLAKGDRRFLGLSKTCASCHEDVHKGELGNQCADCHGQEKPFKEAPLFAHPKTFPLTEGHSRAKCSACHTTPKVFKGAATDCLSCHRKEYDATTKPAHAVAKLGTDCVKCHSTTNWTTAKYTHPESFALIGAHTEAACTACHTAGAAQEHVTAFGGSRSCSACHATPHDATLTAASTRIAGSGDACGVCHLPGDRQWREGITRMTRELHGQTTGFALVVPHDKQSCAKCHTGLTDTAPQHAVSLAARPAAFPGRDAEKCEVCHSDPHGGQFAQSPSKGACLACHEKTTFTPSLYDTKMHAQCAFQLDGSHRAVACSSCHELVDGIRKFAGTKKLCGECHEDIHKGAFDRPHMPLSRGGKSGCARCHDTTDFRRVEWTGADHEQWTGSALTGKHEKASCNDCHRRGAGPSAAAMPFREAPKACLGCHTDIHAGQFRENDATDCARCHIGTETFKLPTFDHQKNSRFGLDEDHAKLACSACHKPVDAAGTEIVRYKPLGVKCADCHDPRSRKARSGGATP